MAKVSQTTDKRMHPLLVQEDRWLAPYAEVISHRTQRFAQMMSSICDAYESLYHFAGLHHELGFHYDQQQRGWIYREWLPQAYAAALIGDFNGWNPVHCPLRRDKNGLWAVFLPDDIYGNALKDGSLLKVRITSRLGVFDRIPALIRRAVQNEQTKDFSGQIYAPPKAFDWSGNDFDAAHIKTPLIYECHIGMAQEKEGIGTYAEFEEKILPRIKAAGYNTLQIMGIQEHPYYGSFGYHVSSFFAPSSRFGTPEALKSLIKTAHKMGMAVVIDLVHSHAVKNLREGLNKMDGTDYQYFHPGERGQHPAWDSKLFDYGKWEVLRFLLSNVRYWLEEFHFDGFRFDGVTSMLYHHHGNIAFDHLSKYFDDGIDTEALLYLQLANTLLHQIKPAALSIAEEVSGMPGLARKVEEGGLGFDYRLGMGLPDYWIKLLKTQSDSDWDVEQMWHTMLNRRTDEKTIAYCESHDQALVGDKTIAFRLMDKEMYSSMRISDENLAIDRGMALHKMIRLFTLSLGGEGYLNFMGNEFGHPEWIDFPRQGNNWSYKYARRQWSLADSQILKYKYLAAFDKQMLAIARQFGLLEKDAAAEKIYSDKTHNTLVFTKKELIFLFNFHPTKSSPDYRFALKKTGTYRIILNTDSPAFGGHARINDQGEYPTNQDGELSLYNTNRTALILCNQSLLTF